MYHSFPAFRFAASAANVPTHRYAPLFTLVDLCVSSLRRGRASLLCLAPILTDDPRRESIVTHRCVFRFSRAAPSSGQGAALRLPTPCLYNNYYYYHN